MKKKTLKITAKDIELGVQESYCDCPIARAVRRAWPRRTVTVRQEGVFVGESLRDQNLWIAPLPEELVTFLEGFDAGKPVAPLTATLEFR